MNEKDNDFYKDWCKFLKAIKANDIEQVKSLIEAGVDIHTKDYEMPLHIAARNGYIEIVNLFIEKGVDLTIKELDGRTALDWAKLRSHNEVFNCLIEAGAKKK